MCFIFKLICLQNYGNNPSIGVSIGSITLLKINSVTLTGVKCLASESLLVEIDKKCIEESIPLNPNLPFYETNDWHSSVNASIDFFLPVKNSWTANENLIGGICQKMNIRYILPVNQTWFFSKRTIASIKVSIDKSGIERNVSIFMNCFFLFSKKSSWASIAKICGYVGCLLLSKSIF